MIGDVTSRPDTMPGDPAPAGVLADVLAYLAQRRDNAATVAARSPEHAEWARDRRRQLDIIIGDLTAGLHEGAALVRADLAAAADP